MPQARRSSRPPATTHTVRQGDSLSAIAAEHLGNEARWREIYNLNRDTVRDPSLIRPGMVLRLPAEAGAGGDGGGGQEEGPAPDAGAPGGTVTVRPGDSLAAIAARVLGDPGRWHDLFQANRDQIRNPSVIHPGMVLKVPGANGEHRPAPTPDPGPTPDISRDDEGHQYEVYYVGPGDSLAAIAGRITGDGTRWKELWELNKEAVPKPGLIHVGTPLRLPPGWKAPDRGAQGGGQGAPGRDDRPAPSGDFDTRQREFRGEVYRSLNRYEGGNPAAVHYDSGRVNIGKGSWTGGHIVRLMDIYAQVAAENDATEKLYGYFGGQAAFQAIQERFRRHGVDAWLSPNEENAFKAAGKDPLFAGAQDRKGGEDVLRYLNNIAGFSVPYPWLDGEGTISEIGAMVLCHAGHQSGSPQRAYDAVRSGRNAEQLQRAYGSEAAFLQAVADLIVSWVQPQYRRGVRNRYNWLFSTYGLSRRYKL